MLPVFRPSLVHTEVCILSMISKGNSTPSEHIYGPSIFLMTIKTFIRLRLIKRNEEETDKKATKNSVVICHVLITRMWILEVIVLILF